MDAQFESFRAQLDGSSALRDRIRAVVSEAESASRAATAALLLVHQPVPLADVLGKANAQVEVIKGLYSQLAEILKECPGQYYRYHGDWRTETQTVVSMLAFTHWLETGGLLTHAEAQEKLGLSSGEFGLDVEDYLTGGGNGHEPPPYDPSNDPKRKANSGDPGWKYGYWHDMDRRDRIRCKFCGKDIHGGIARFKRHLAGASTKGKKNSTKCKKVPEAASKEMLEFMRAYASKHNVTGESDQDNAGAAHDDEEEDAAATQTVAKRKAETVLIESPTQKTSRTIAGMLRKSPEEVIELRHSKDPSQAALNVGCFKRTSGDKDRVDDHWADFSLLMPFPSMLLDQEPLRLHWSPPGQYGPGYIPPTIHSLRLPLLAKSKKKTHALRDKHELAWQEYGCTLMSDGWTDGRTKHLVNFLVNSPAGTFFIDSVNISSLVANKELLVDLLEKKINDIGRDYVVQICTDNGANYKAAGRLLMERIPTLWWTPCAAHCLNLMLGSICKLKQFSECIADGKRVTTFIYMHTKILDEMRVKTNGKELVRAGATRFATNFLNLQSLHKHSKLSKNYL
ncbi:hypothetical protein ACQ4PT_051984 [Festuca glaucescens]